MKHTKLNTPTYKQPSYVELAQAYIAGARDGQLCPKASEHIIIRSADAYCKLVHQQLDPVLFKQLAQPPANYEEIGSDGTN